MKRDGARLGFVPKSYHLAKLSATMGIFAIAIVGWLWLRPERHQHCIKAAPMILLEYADGHNGNFPRSERGWGDALLALGSGTADTEWVRYFVGVDDDGAHLIRALATGEDVIEDKCTRIYVQGLTKKSQPGIAILFDRNSVKGGDHFRGIPGQDHLREVITTNGEHRMIKDADWPAFVDKQRELLEGEGLTKDEIVQYYGAK